MNSKTKENSKSSWLNSTSLDAAPTHGSSNALGAWPFPNWTTHRPSHQHLDSPPTTDPCRTRTQQYEDMTTELGEAKW